MFPSMIAGTGHHALKLATSFAACGEKGAFGWPFRLLG
jgi:hypothetical protein